VSGRTYLSIGDVLTLLREEFPDVTISKIRFLESQGLVNPERSPSGYRKFFEQDVERLRWVLRQQREHFLPLKVIRDRLAAGDLGDLEAPPEPRRRNGQPAEPAHAGVANGAAGRGLATNGSGPVGGGAVAARAEAASSKAEDDAMARILADASRRAALLPDSVKERSPLRVVPDVAEPTVRREPAERPAEPIRSGSDRGLRRAPAVAATAAAAPVPAGAPEPALAAASDAPAHVKAEAVHRPAHAAPEPTPTSAAAVASGGAADSATPAGRPPAVTSAATPKAPAAAARPTTTSAMVTGASLTIEELCAATGLSEVELAALQGFGLIASTMVAGIPTYNEEALTVANLAAEFRKFGIEPRHLRLYRNAVDREIGLIEQVIIPLLRQRNPESRQRAVEAAEELSTLGQTMRATLLRAALRGHLGG
jgi:DNA-binding transcriptional MerR regulator